MWVPVSVVVVVEGCTYWRNLGCSNTGIDVDSMRSNLGMTGIGRGRVEIGIGMSRETERPFPVWAVAVVAAVDCRDRAVL